MAVNFGRFIGALTQPNLSIFRPKWPKHAAECQKTTRHEVNQRVGERPGDFFFPNKDDLLRWGMLLIE